MEKWQRILRQGITDVRKPARDFGLNPEGLQKTAAQFRFCVSKSYYKLIRKKDDPVFRQCIPDPLELESCEDLMEDPLGEETHSPAPNIVMRYPDRCLFLVSDRCASYCRFCTRKRKFGTGKTIDPEHLEAGFRFIEKTEAVRDVLISGGDPFLLEDDRIEMILKRLHAVPHVDMLRIGTRTPCVLPERITCKLVRMLKKYHPLYVNVHFNHPDELTPEARKALARLADAGIPLGCQTVLLKGVNDNPETLKKLMHELLKCRVKPYYLFQSDLIRGNEHFRVPLKRALEILRTMYGHTSGMAVPHFVIDLPGGKGKVPLIPEYRSGIHGRCITFRTFRGEFCDYPDLPEDSL